ncbi:MAG: putative bifunctional diguanylate cyclase/phosphodiesterase [Gammaproteobacteria bacterium]
MSPASQHGRDNGPQSQANVLVVGADDPSDQWPDKWLQQEDLSAVRVDSLDAAANAVANSQLSVILVEAASRDESGQPLYRQILDDVQLCELPLVVLCQDINQVEQALAAGVTDIVRKPVSWQVVSRRVRTLAEFRRTQLELAAAKSDILRGKQQIEDSRRALSNLSDTDRLTGLPSLTKFRDILARALCQTDTLALFLIGIERFHVINEAHGRETGDRILEAVGARLRECLVRPELHAPGSTGVLAACAAKLDSVRFGLFLPFSGNHSHLQTIRRVLTEVLSEPLHIDGRTIYLTSSIGGAVSPGDGDEAGKLLLNAEHAMMTVKRRGGGFSLFAEDTGMSSARLLELDRWLREAVSNNELQVAYQPLVNLWNNRIVGAEALLRWHKEPHGFISPAEFIPVAERSGIVVQIGDMVIDRACAELRRWHDRGFENQRMAINLSLIQLHRGDVKRSVENAIDRYDLNPGNIELEISERGAIGDDQRIIRQLHEIKSIGVRLSLDDFGTGDAAIEYLKRLPIDILKLDRSYVSGALENGADAVIAKALVGLARSMNLTVIAEGVESKEQHQLLRDWGCHIYQGFYCSPAVFSDAFIKLLEAQTSELSQDIGP